MMQTQEENGKVGMYVAICESDEEEVDTCNRGTTSIATTDHANDKFRRRQKDQAM